MPRTALAVIMITMIGCVTPQFTEERQARMPEYPQLYQGMTKAFMATRIADPLAAQYGAWVDPAPGYLQGPFYTCKLVGWVWAALINTKNDVGAYTGFRPWFFMYGEDGRVRGWNTLWWVPLHRFDGP